MRRSLRIPPLATLVILLLVAAAAGPADAKTKRFKPLDFTPVTSGINHTRSPQGLGGVGGTASFSALLGLPAGSKITGIRFYSSGAASRRTASVTRWAGGAIAGVESTEFVPSPETPALTEGWAASDELIVAGQHYFVLVNAGPSTYVWAVDVDYNP